MSEERTPGQDRFLRLIERGRWEYATRINARCRVVVLAVTPPPRRACAAGRAVPRTAQCHGD